MTVVAKHNDNIKNNNNDINVDNNVDKSQIDYHRDDSNNNNKNIITGSDTGNIDKSNSHVNDNEYNTEIKDTGAKSMSNDNDNANANNNINNAFAITGNPVDIPEIRSKHSFLSYVKTGLGAQISTSESQLTGPRASVKINLNIKRFHDQNLSTANSDKVPISKNIAIYGPGDVKRITSNIVIRTEPDANTTNFKPNYFPYIEFSNPGFPWLFTPAIPKGTPPFNSRLSPWICLIVLEENEFEFTGPSTTGGVGSNIPMPIDPMVSLPQIKIKDPVNSLPDLNQVWATAHCMITTDITEARQMDANTIKTILSNQPHKAISRILCPRRLKENTKYYAFLVPSFEVGRLSGLGQPIPDNMRGTTYAWKTVANSPSEISQPGLLVPIYYQWVFTTSQSGDFEALIRRFFVYDENEKRYKLNFLDSSSKKIGLIDIDVSKPFPEIPGLKDPLYMGSALWAPGAAQEYEKYKMIINDPNAKNEIKKFLESLKEFLDLPEKLQWSFANTSNKNNDPVITPPVYGKWHAANFLVSKISNDYRQPAWINEIFKSVTDLKDENMKKRIIDFLNKLKQNSPYPWLEELNLNPVNRIAAGIGSKVVQDLQEELMASAWDQVGTINDANRRIRQGHLAMTISGNLYERNAQKMDQDEMIQVFSPIHSKILVDVDYTTTSSKITTTRSISSLNGIVHQKDGGNNNNNDSSFATAITASETKKVTVSKAFDQSPIPNSFFSPSFKKTVSRRGKIHRKLYDKDSNIRKNLLERFNHKDSNNDPKPATYQNMLSINNIFKKFYSPENPLYNIKESDIPTDSSSKTLNDFNPQVNDFDNGDSNNGNDDVKNDVKTMDSLTTPRTSEIQLNLDGFLPNVYGKLIKDAHPVKVLGYKLSSEIQQSQIFFNSIASAKGIQYSNYMSIHAIGVTDNGMLLHFIKKSSDSWICLGDIRINTNGQSLTFIHVSLVDSRQGDNVTLYCVGVTSDGRLWYSTYNMINSDYGSWTDFTEFQPVILGITSKNSSVSSLATNKKLVASNPYLSFTKSSLSVFDGHLHCIGVTQSGDLWYFNKSISGNSRNSGWTMGEVIEQNGAGDVGDIVSVTISDLEVIAVTRDGNIWYTHGTVLNNNLTWTPFYDLKQRMGDPGKITEVTCVIKGFGELDYWLDFICVTEDGLLWYAHRIGQKDTIEGWTKFEKDSINKSTHFSGYFLDAVVKDIYLSLYCITNTKDGNIWYLF